MMTGNRDVLERISQVNILHLVVLIISAKCQPKCSTTACQGANIELLILSIYGGLEFN